MTVNMYHSEIDLHPTKCNLCGGRVIYTSNKKIYGKVYGSGYCYLCTKCGAYVGTHKPRPREAFGILSNAEMRKMKHICHEQFDKFWKNKGSKARKKCYARLAELLNIPVQSCHFGYFDMVMLKKAYLAIQIMKEEQNTAYQTTIQ